MSKDEPLLSNCQLETAEPSRNYARVPGYKKKDKKKTRQKKKNERRRNRYARVRRYKITSMHTLGLLVRGDPQNEGLRGLQPRALGSKLDYFYAVTPAPARILKVLRPFPFLCSFSQHSTLFLVGSFSFLFSLFQKKSNNILQAEAEKLSGFTPSIIQPEAAGRGLYARCKTR